MRDTKILYYVEGDQIPYVKMLAIPPERVRLRDVTNKIGYYGYTFHFKTLDKQLNR